MAIGCTLLLAGCSPLSADEEPGEAIGFNSDSPLLLDDVTKTTSYFSNGARFGVFAFLQDNVTWSGKRYQLKPNLMYNRQVTVGSPSYSYSPVTYWPSDPPFKVSFWAYYPYSASPTLLKKGTYTAYNSDTANLPDVQYTTDGRTDLMLSEVAQNKTYANCSPAGVVSLNFHHVLSKIDFVVEKDSDPYNNYTVTLTSVSFENVYNTGVFRHDNQTSTPTHANCAWDVWNQLRGNLPIFSGSQEVVTTPAAISDPTTHEDVSIITIPQTLVGTEARMRIVYTLVARDESFSLTNDYSFSFTADWAKDTHYTYTISIRPNHPIQFTVSWSSWGTDHTIDLNS